MAKLTVPRLEKYKLGMEAMSMCILCGKLGADTAEHAPFKRDIYQAFTGDGKAWLYYDHELKAVLEDRDARELKPKKNLCNICNNRTSIKPDRAMSETHRYFHGMLDGKQEQKFQQKIEEKGARFAIDLKRYFAKGLACTIDRYDLPVPAVLGRIFVHSKDHEALDLNFSIISNSKGSEILEAGPIIASVPSANEANAAEWIRAGNVPDAFAMHFVYGAIRYDVALIVPIAERMRM